MNRHSPSEADSKRSLDLGIEYPEDDIISEADPVIHHEDKKQKVDGDGLGVPVESYPALIDVSTSEKQSRAGMVPAPNAGFVPPMAPFPGMVPNNFFQVQMQQFQQMQQMQQPMMPTGGASKNGGDDDKPNSNGFQVFTPPGMPPMYPGNMNMMNPFMMPMSAPFAAGMPMPMMFCSQYQPSRGFPIVLGCDRKHLSEYQVLVREQLEIFEASQEDIESNTQGRKKRVVLGQIGLRCKHCAAFPLRARGRGAVYYPARLEYMYQASQNMSSTHLCSSCQHMPPVLKQQLKRLRERRDNASGGKKYWADGFRILGLYETDDGLKLKQDTSTEKTDEAPEVNEPEATELKLKEGGPGEKNNEVVLELDHVEDIPNVSTEGLEYAV